MIIGITTDFSGPAEGGAHIEDPACEVMGRLVAGHPEHRFHVFNSSSADGMERRLPSNAAFHKKPRLNHPLIQKLWYDLQLSRLLKKHRVDVLLTMDGYCSATTSVPQCILMPGSFSSEGTTRSKGIERAYHWLLPGFLSKSALIITGSHRQRALLQTFMKKRDKDAEIIYGGINSPVSKHSVEAKAAVLQQYTEGMEYFIYEGPLQTGIVLPILKAFSLFKKRQRTSWKLVLNETESTNDKKFDQLLRSYKYRDDVVLTSVIKKEERGRLQGSAYGAIVPGANHYSIQPALSWMARGIPCIVAEGNPVQEIDPQAALFFRPEELSDMAERLMELYKDEALHSRLSSQGYSLAKKWDWQTATDALWEKLVRMHGSPQ